MENNIKPRFNQLLENDNTHETDRERKALFFILAGNDDLYVKAKHIYDFTDHSIKIECLEENTVDLSSSSRRLVKLAFNLFNGYPADVYDTLSLLDDNNFDLAINAIKLRFNM